MTQPGHSAFNVSAVHRIHTPPLLNLALAADVHAKMRLSESVNTEGGLTGLHSSFRKGADS